MVYAPSKKTLREIREACTRLKRRWKTLRPHKEQSRLWRSKARFKVVAGGRRSGKSELAKRDGALEAFSNTRTFHDYPFLVVFGAPTGTQVKNLYWRELDNLIPSEYVVDSNETSLTKRLWNGTEIMCVSLMEAARIEGRPIDVLRVDEFSEVKKRVWTRNLRPALSTEGRFGNAWLYGVPRGGRGGHFHDEVVKARNPENCEWEYFHWTSASVLAQTEEGRADLEEAKRDLDPKTFAEEYEATFQTFSGRAYYPFEWDLHASHRLAYNPHLPLILMFDFNREPGVCAIGQEQEHVGQYGPQVARKFTAIIDEVWIPTDSNTRRVCEVIRGRYGKEGVNHRGEVLAYGDASGGYKGHTVPYDGTDWTEIDQMMRQEFGAAYRSRVPRANGSERVRVNTVNSRLLNTMGVVRMLVDPVKAPHVCNDFDSVLVLAGTMGDLDKSKKSNKELTHLSDGIGYYLVEAHPLGGTRGRIRQI